MACISKQALVALQKTLKTDAAIGAKYGITRQAVHQLRKKYGLDYNRNKNTIRNKEIAALFNKGVSGTRVAQKLKLSASQIYRILATARKKRKKR